MKKRSRRVNSHGHQASDRCIAPIQGRDGQQTSRSIQAPCGAVAWILRPGGVLAGCPHPHKTSPAPYASIPPKLSRSASFILPVAEALGNYIRRRVSQDSNRNGEGRQTLFTTLWLKIHHEAGQARSHQDNVRARTTGTLTVASKFPHKGSPIPARSSGSCSLFSTHSPRRRHN